MSRWLSHVQDGVRLPSKNVGNDVIYQIFVDRFAAPSRPRQPIGDGRFEDPSRRDWYKFWGGDLRGVIERLDYVKRLGATQIWLTPVFENHMVTIARDKFGEKIAMTPYHGYWIKDWFRLNPYFTEKGSRDFALIDELIAKAKPEIGILLDTVCNHTSPSDPEPPSSEVGPFYRDGVLVASFDEDQKRKARGESTRFHHFGPIVNYQSQFELEQHQLDGLADLDQTDPLVHAYLRDAHAFWMERFPGIAGYRMDTVKHIDLAYWREFERDFYARFPDKLIVGEYFDGGPLHDASAELYRSLKMTMFDFDFRHALVDVFLNGASLSRLTRVWENDAKLIDAHALVTFAENHDLPRLRGLGVRYEAIKQILALLFVARGVPCLYYGQEQDLFHPGDPGDPFCRPMMTSFDERHELFLLVQTLAHLRKTHLALRHGRTHLLVERDDVLVFERVHEHDRVLLAVAVGGKAAPAVHATGLALADGAYRNLAGQGSVAVRNASATFDLPPYGVVVLASGKAP